MISQLITNSLHPISVDRSEIKESKIIKRTLAPDLLSDKVNKVNEVHFNTIAQGPEKNEFPDHSDKVRTFSKVKPQLNDNYSSEANYNRLSLLEISEKLTYSLKQFEIFSCLGANTWVHLNRDDNFIPTGDMMSVFPGVQSVANWYKGRDQKSLGKDLINFANTFIRVVVAIYEEAQKTKSQKLKKIRSDELKKIRSMLLSAFEGYGENGGMKGLLKTHDTDLELLDEIKSAINSMENCIREIHDEINGWFKITEKPINEDKLLPFCEALLWDEERWEKEIAADKSAELNDPSLFKYYGEYCGPFICNQAMSLMGWNPWDTIFTDVKTGWKIVLGVLPTKSTITSNCDLSALKHLGIKAVLSVVEPFENHTKDGVTSNPITPSDWEAAEIDHFQLKTPDFESVSLDLIMNGIAYLIRCRKENLDIYLHCKAGRGRSALILACFFVYELGLSATEAYQLIKLKRNQAGFSAGSPKHTTLMEFEMKSKATKIKLAEKL